MRLVLDPKLGPVVKKLVGLLSAEKLNKSLAMNLAAALGKIALYQPTVLSQDAAMIFKQWCLSLRMLKEEPERQYAYLGFCAVIPSCQGAAVENFPFLCSSLCNYKTCGSDLDAKFKEILQYLKQ